MYQLKNKFLYYNKKQFILTKRADVQKISKQRASGTCQNLFLTYTQFPPYIYL